MTWLIGSNKIYVDMSDDSQFCKALMLLKDTQCSFIAINFEF